MAIVGLRTGICAERVGNRHNLVSLGVARLATDFEAAHRGSPGMPVLPDGYSGLVGERELGENLNTLKSQKNRISKAVEGALE